MSALRLGLCHGCVSRVSGSQSAAQPSHSRLTQPWHRALCAALLLAFWAGASAAQDEALQGQAERKKALLEGTHVFRRLLHEKDCTAIDGFDELKNEDPEKTVIIIFGNLDHVKDVPGGLQAFVRKGGAVLLASDRAPSEGKGVREVIANLAGVAINGQAVVQDDQKNVYLGKEYCPLLQPAPNARLNFLADPKDPRTTYAVATNVPSYLELERGHLPVVAMLPAQCRLENRRRKYPALPFMVAGDVGDGRVIVAADHSIFINEMMLPEDVQNVEFSEACIRYLCDDKRNRVLFYDEFGLETKFDVPLRTPQISIDELIQLLLDNPDKAVLLADHVIRLGEEVVDKVERRDAVNAAIDRFVGWLDQPEGKLFALVAILATAVLVVYGLLRLGLSARFRHEGARPDPLVLSFVGAAVVILFGVTALLLWMRVGYNGLFVYLAVFAVLVVAVTLTKPSPAAAMLPELVSERQPTGPLTQQRTVALLRSGRMNEPAAQLARRWLLSQNLGVPNAASPGGALVTFSVGWWAARGLRRRLERIWLLAAGRSRTITPAELWRLQRELDALAASRRRGEWAPMTKERGGAA
jgi:hypothetical protein